MLAEELLLPGLSIVRRVAWEDLLPILERVPVERVRGLDHVLVGAATAVLVVLGATFLVPVAASHLLFDGLGREDVAALRSRAALCSLKMLVGQVTWACGCHRRPRLFAPVDAHAFELHVLAAHVAHLLVLEVLEPGQVAVVL